MDERTPEAWGEIALRERVLPFPGDKTRVPPFPGDKTKLPEAKPRSRRRRFVVLGVLGLLVLLSFGVYRITAVIEAPKQPGPGRQATLPPVDVATIGTGDIGVTVNALGTVTPIATVTVKTRVDGHLMEVGFEEGQTVKKGDFLAQIDPRPFEATKAQYEGQLAHDQGLLDQARMDLARYQTLLKQNSVARQQAEDQVYIVKQHEGSVRLDQAQVDAQKLNLIYAHICSPIDGRIGLRMVDPGNYVQTSDPGLAVVAQMHPISVIFIVPEDDIPEIMAAMGAGKDVEVTAYDRANVAPLSVGKVVALDSQVDPTTGTVRLRANFANLDNKLFPNQFVNTRILVKTLHDVVTVPSSAIQHGAPGTYVYVVGSDDTASARKVDLGPQDGAMYAIKSGLSPGEKVVVDGADSLRQGAKVLIASDAETRGGGAALPAMGAPPNKDGAERSVGSGKDAASPGKSANARQSQNKLTTHSASHP
jgi:membrane fusion protein, multidrug efflux system